MKLRFKNWQEKEGKILIYRRCEKTETQICKDSETFKEVEKEAAKTEKALAELQVRQSEVHETLKNKTQMLFYREDVRSILTQNDLKKQNKNNEKVRTLLFETKNWNFAVFNRKNFKKTREQSWSFRSKIFKTVNYQNVTLVPWRKLGGRMKRRKKEKRTGHDEHSTKTTPSAKTPNITQKKKKKKIIFCS